MAPFLPLRNLKNLETCRQIDNNNEPITSSRSLFKLIFKFLPQDDQPQAIGASYRTLLHFINKIN